MAAQVSQSRSWWFLVALNAPAFSLSLVHLINNPNLYHYVLTNFIESGLLDSDRLNTALGSLGILGLIMATLAQPVAGLLSDRTHSRWGARYPFFWGGIFVSAIALLLIAHAESWFLLIFSIVLVQVGLNAIQSPMQALIPDYVQPAQRGIAASLKTVLELVGIVVSGVVVVLFLGNNTRPTLAVLVSVSFLILSTLLSMQSVPNKTASYSLQQQKGSIGRYLRFYMKDANRLGLRTAFVRQSAWHIFRQRSILWWLISRFLFYSCFNTLGKFSITYLTDVFGYSGEEARSLQGVILLVTGILVFAVTLAGGWFSDQFGKKRVAAAGGVMASAATLVLIEAPGLTFAIIAICIIGMGSGVFFSAGWALITTLVPPRRAGFYLGFANIATTLGGILGLLGGYVIDAVNASAEDPATGYTILFVIIMLLFAISAYATTRIREPE